jgi:hypothetical protein
MLSKTLIFCGAVLCAAIAPAADTVVVCPRAFRDALRPWLEYRGRQGHEFEFVPPGSVAEMRAAIQAIAARSKLRCIVVVGDAESDDLKLRIGAGLPRKPSPNKLCVPTSRVPAHVIRKLGTDTDIATDNPLADLDGDGTPELAVGRLTADSPAELAIMIRKIVEYERPENLGLWCRQIHLVAGVGGFGFLADTALEMCAKRFITSGVPAAFGTTMTHASWRSPYCPDPRRFGETTLERLNEGSLFWVYMGHGHRRGLDLLHVPGQRGYPILNSSDVKHLHCPRGMPLALFLACYTGAFDQKEDCLAEELLRQEGGPVAVLCGSRTTMPYAMGVLALELMRECFVSRRETIGEILLHAKRNTLLRPRDDEESKGLDWLARTLSVNSDLAAERAEHAQLFNLLGDPLLRVPHPEQLKLDVAGTARVGEELVISGETKLAGRCSLELVVRRDRLKFSPPLRLNFDADAAKLEEYQQTYSQANDPRLTSTSLDVSVGQFSAKLRVPATSPGACHVRVFVQGARNIALGAADVEVRGAGAGADASSK